MKKATASRDGAEKKHGNKVVIKTQKNATLIQEEYTTYVSHT